MDNNLFRLVTFHNPLSEPFKILYNKEIVRTIPAGGTMQIVKMWADAGKADIVNIMMRRDKVNLLNKEKRAEYEAKVILGEEGSLLGQQPTQNELANELLARKQDPTANKTAWKFDPLTGKPLNPELEPMPEMPKAQPTYSNPEVGNIMAGVNQQGTGALPAQDLTKDDEPVADNMEAKKAATKEEVIAWARATLPIDFNNEDVKTAINVMDTEELKKEFRYYETA